MRMMKVLMTVTLPFLLAACADMQTACNSTNDCIETVTAGGGLRGTEETLVAVRLNGQAPSYMVRSSEPLARQVVRAVAPVVAGSVVSALSCGGNCGGGGSTTFNVSGGQAVAQAQSDSSTDVGVDISIGGGLCPPELMVNGVCPAGLETGF